MASNMKAVKLRIKSVESTMQITKAMQLVASSKLRKAKERADISRPYFQELYRTLVTIADGNTDFTSPYVRPQENPKTCYVVIGDSQEEITLEAVSTTYGDAQPGGFGGGSMEFGQMQQRPEQGSAPAEEGESDGRQQAEGEMPSFEEGEVPSFEEGSSPEGEAQGEMPGFAEGETPEEFAGGGAPGESRSFAGQEQDVTEEEETTASNKVSLSELDSSVWIWLGISAAVVIAGLLIAFFYRRGRL